MPAVVVGSIRGLDQANIEASWLLVPTISGTLLSAPARAASIGCRGSSSTPWVRPYASVGEVAALRRCTSPAARRSARCGNAPVRRGRRRAVRGTRARAAPGFPVGDQRKRGALGDRPGEQAIRGGAGQQRQHRRRARGLAEDGDPLRVTTEGDDVVGNPAQRRDLVAQSEVVVESGAQPAELRIPEHPEPVGHVDHHDVAVGGQPRAVVELQLAGAVDERAARNPHHHRQRALPAARW